MWYFSKSFLFSAGSSTVLMPARAAAVRLMLECDTNAIRAAGSLFNVSDILLDRRDLLEEYARVTGLRNPLPGRENASAYNIMDCSRLKGLGWSPRGQLDLT